LIAAAGGGEAVHHDCLVLADGGKRGKGDLYGRWRAASTATATATAASS
jgi:hypothetical protein